MPGYDGSGPRGFGPMTGWGRGYCNPGGRPAGMAPGRGAGFGRGGWSRGFRRGGGPGSGWGGGFGRGYGAAGRGYGAAGWGYGPPAAPYGGEPYGMSPEREAGYLREEAEAIREELEAVQRRIAELESTDDASTEGARRVPGPLTRLPERPPRGPAVSRLRSPFFSPCRCGWTCGTRVVRLPEKRGCGPCAPADPVNESGAGTSGKGHFRERSKRASHRGGGQRDPERGPCHGLGVLVSHSDPGTAHPL